MPTSLTRRKLGKRLVDIRSLLDRLDAFMLSVNEVRLNMYLLECHH